MMSVKKWVDAKDEEDKNEAKQKINNLTIPAIIQEELGAYVWEIIRIVAGEDKTDLLSLKCQILIHSFSF